MPKKREEREIERWITVRGARVPIFKGQSVEEAIKESVGKRGTGKEQSGKQKASESTKVHKDMTEEEKKKKKKEVGATISDEEWKSAKEDVMDMMDDNTARQNLSGEDKKRWTAAEKYLDKYGVAVGDLADEGNGRGNWEKIQAAQRDIKELYEKGARNHYARQQAAKKADAGAKAAREKADVSKENYHLNADQRRAKETTQNAEAKDRYGKDWNGLTDEQKKSIDDQLKKNHPLWYGGKMNSVEKRAGEVWDKAQKTAKTDGGENARVGVYKKQLKDVQEDIQQFESTPKSLRSKDYDQKLGELKKKERDLKGWIDNDINARRNEDIKEKQLAANKQQASQAAGKKVDSVNKRADQIFEEGQKHRILSKPGEAGKRGTTPEFKDYNEAKEYYQKRFSEMSPQNMNRIARNMQIGGRGKEKIAALAEAKAKEWQGKQGGEQKYTVTGAGKEMKSFNNPKDADDYVSKQVKAGNGVASDYNVKKSDAYGHSVTYNGTKISPNKDGSWVAKDKNGVTRKFDSVASAKAAISGKKADTGVRLSDDDARSMAVDYVRGHVSKKDMKEVGFTDADLQRLDNSMGAGKLGNMTVVSSKVLKVADNARKQLSFDKGYAEISEGHFKQSGVSDEKVVAAMNASDPKYSYEIRKETTKGSFGMPNATVQHTRLYRTEKKPTVSKESAGAMSNVYDGGKKVSNAASATVKVDGKKKSLETMGAPRAGKYGDRYISFGDNDYIIDSEGRRKPGGVLVSTHKGKDAHGDYTGSGTYSLYFNRENEHKEYKTWAEARQALIEYGKKRRGQ